MWLAWWLASGGGNEYSKYCQSKMRIKGSQEGQTDCRSRGMNVALALHVPQ